MEHRTTIGTIESLLTETLSRIESVQLKQAEAIIELGKGTQEIAKAQARWFGLFEREMGDGMSHTVRPADEWLEAEKRAREEILALQQSGYPAGMTGREMVDALWTMQSPAHDTDN